ncbi:lysylphosphatidylglycerol synthase transmembrane domain-containing protein [Anaerosphaera multitolerans]|uniref:Phosphatidylglycerol lysyltransferase n=1 Tax=Anaerosphaera multitolerans TaxID=2487351 RepID=A0A437S7T3_9FIRM|nr:lysylphosphatidylglycerol synthase transmembrane domain-containing protein [Anaerosphaera multitolerans]RVU55135.1 UPF0104 family protein [Anaerosphaera multitolerans]
MKNYGKNKNFIFNILILIFLSAVVFSIIFKNENKRALMLLLFSAKKIYIFFGVLCALIFIVGDAINTKRLLYMFNYKFTFLRTLKYAFVGFFFSGITPSATGGQPMQIYEMKKDGVEISRSTLALFVSMLSNQLTSFFLGVLCLTWYLSQNLYVSKGILSLVIVGLIINICVIAFILLCIFNPKISLSFAKFLGFIINKLPFLQEGRKQTLKLSLQIQIEEYNIFSKYIVKNKLTLFKTFLTTCIQMVSMFGVSYLVYLSLGQDKYSVMDIISMQCLIYIASSYMPLPGSVGVNETGFLLLFADIYPKNLINGALLLTRGINFYLLLIISFLALILYKLFSAGKSPINISKT